jgi:hypothetical protein
MPTRPRPKRGMIRDEPRLRYRFEWVHSHYEPDYEKPLGYGQWGAKTVTSGQHKILQERVNGIWVDVV